MQADVLPGTDGGTPVLSHPVEDAWPAEHMRQDGTVFVNMQRDLTREREEVQYSVLEGELASRPGDDRHSAVFFSRDAASMTWATALPRHGQCPNRQWVEITARSLGLPSPACFPLWQEGAALGVGEGRVALDAYGDGIAAAPRVPGDHHARYRHDPLVAVLLRAARLYAGTAAQAEDTGTFGNVMRHSDPYLAGTRTRAPTIDLLLSLEGQDASRERRAVEAKTIHFCPSRYSRGRGGREYCGAVNRRASQVAGERERQMRALDALLFGVRVGGGENGQGEGPMLSRMRALGPILPVVVGGFGEWSKGLHDLLCTFAEMGKAQWLSRLGSPTADAAKSTLMWLMREEVGMVCLQGHAQLVLARVEAVREQGSGGCGQSAGETSHGREAFGGLGVSSGAGLLCFEDTEQHWRALGLGGDGEDDGGGSGMGSVDEWRRFGRE